MDRGLTVLRILAGEGASGGLTVTELAAKLDVGRPVVYRLVASLEAADMVIRRQGGRITLGPGLLPLASAVLPGLRDTAGPHLRELAEEAGLTATLTIADRDEALAIAVVEPRWAGLHVSYREGTRHPLDRGAAGRAILACDDDSVDWVSSDGELQPGAFGIAAPVRGVPGLRGSVGLVALAKFDPKVFGPMVLKAARGISASVA